MKKTLFLIAISIFNISLVNADFNFDNCNNQYFNKCPSFIIWKVWDFQDFNEFNSETWKEKNITFDINNNFVLLNNKLEKFNKNIFLSQNWYKYNSNFFIPKKESILIVNIWWLSSKKDIEKYLNNEMKKYYLNILKENKNSVIEDSFQGFLEVTCSNNKIYFGKINNINFDEFSRPFKNFNLDKLQDYLQKQIKSCKNFNKLFWLKSQWKIEKKEEIKNNVKQETIKEKSWFEKLLDKIKWFFEKIF